MQINEENYRHIRDGIPVKVKKQNGQIEEKKAIVIDFTNPENNDFLAIREMKIHGDLYRRRTDIVGFVNGIPLLFIELKKNSVDVQNAYTDNYTDYLDTIPHLFYYNAFLMLSNGTEAKVGTLGSKYEFFHEWKRLSEQEEGNVALETMLRGICKKDNFLDLLENFILFDHSDGETVKILARNHQYLGVNEAVKAYEARKLNNGKLGVFWHTQGSGKSYSMVFLSQKIRRKFAGSPTIVILTDRDELNTQISDTFENCGLLGKTKAAKYIATSGDDLITKLQGNPSFIFTLIQKFNKKDVQPIIPDHDIIIMSDEAHRSQYGIFADNMVNLLPTAARIGFTGTPLLLNDNITERTFGGYISIYDFKRAVEDKATVPLYYENRGEKILDLDNPDITDKILDAIEATDLDPNQTKKLEREFKKEIHIMTAPQRLKSVAKDFVSHYSDLWTSGKAMFVCLNKVTCVRMYNLVQNYWEEEIKRLEGIKSKVSQQEVQELERKIKWMKETEMAVVISQEQNEIQTFKKWDLDIKPHREKMEKRELDKEFKDKDNPLRVVFVCAMWLTGFDVKCLSCLYLDKPLKAHTLMQTIARANRVAEGKSNGLIIDYIGIVKALRKALADYTANVGGTIERSEDHMTCEFKIRDNGIGMSEEFIKNELFTPFVQADNSPRSDYNGTGLGMPIVKQLVEKMGGTITVESKLGEGSCFTVILPFKIDTNARPEEKEDFNADISGVRILLVEDNELNAEIAEFMLTENGAKVETVNNGLEAVQHFEASEPGTYDVILMDVMMPVMDGLTAARTIRALERQDAKTIPIIAMTANAFREDAEKCMEAGMNAHLAKPLDDEKIKQTISEELRKQNACHE